MLYGFYFWLSCHPLLPQHINFICCKFVAFFNRIFHVRIWIPFPEEKNQYRSNCNWIIKCGRNYSLWAIMKKWARFDSTAFLCYKICHCGVRNVKIWVSIKFLIRYFLHKYMFISSHWNFYVLPWPRKYMVKKSPSTTM